MRPYLSFFSLVLAGVLALTACFPALNNGQNPPPVATADQTQQAIAVQKTVAVQQTISVLDTLIARSSQPAPTGGVPTTAPTQPTPQGNTPTLRPSSTPMPSATLIPTQDHTSTPAPTETQTVACNAATFVKDVTYPDGSTVVPGQALTKTWRLQNTGSCTWGSGYALVFARGEKMGGPDVVELNAAIKPGETVDFSVSLVAPTTTGDYAGYWQIRAPGDITFGTGNKKEPFWVKIKVATTTMSGTGLIENLCSAAWRNNTDSIPCPSPKPDYTNGAVYRVDNPKLEGGSTDDEPALVMIPKNGTNGMINGRFPALKVQSGDHFVSLVGCMNNASKCSVIFTLSYTIDGTTITSLKSWEEVYDNNFTRIDVDLNSLAGQSVQFILTVTNKDGDSVDDQAFWLRPYIKR